jgi:hypothetical protein
VDPKGRHEFSAAMRRVAQGDREAIRDAFHGAWPPVRAFCARLLARRPAA